MLALKDFRNLDGNNSWALAAFFSSSPDVTCPSVLVPVLRDYIITIRILNNSSNPLVSNSYFIPC